MLAWPSSRQLSRRGSERSVASGLAAGFATAPARSERSPRGTMRSVEVGRKLKLSRSGPERLRGRIGWQLSAGRLDP
eukprot:15302593-Alexandrium_andersonii.AAC.1